VSGGSNAHRVRLTSKALANIVVAEDEDRAHSLVSQGPRRNAEAVLQHRVGHIQAGQEPELDHPRQPQGCGEVGEVRAFRGRREVEDVLDAGRQLLKVEAPAEACLCSGAKHILDLF
jgi:hypothetical protein